MNKALALLCLLGCAASAETGAIASGRVFSVTCTDPAVEAAVRHAAEWASASLAMAVQMESLPISPQRTIEAMADAAALKVVPRHAGLIVMTSCADSLRKHGMIKPDARVAVINVAALQEDKPSEAVLQARLERQAIRAVCGLLGLEPSPNPQSAMYPYATLVMLDQIGRNLDPPWLVKAQRAAQLRGVQLDPANTMFMLN